MFDVSNFDLTGCYVMLGPICCFGSELSCCIFETYQSETSKRASFNELYVYECEYVYIVEGMWHVPCGEMSCILLVFYHRHLQFQTATRQSVSRNTSIFYLISFTAVHQMFVKASAKAYRKQRERDSECMCIFMCFEYLFVCLFA